MKFLIIRFSSFGDILLTSPLIRCLRKKYPDSTIDFAVKSNFTDVISDNENINNIVILPDNADNKDLKRIAKVVKENRYDYILDIHGNFRSWYISIFSGSKVLRWEKPRFKRWLLVNFKKNKLDRRPVISLRYLETAFELGVEDDGKGLDFRISDDSIQTGHDLLESLGLADKKIAAIAPGAKWPTKRWGESNYAELAKKLISSGFDGILTLGSSSERELCENICAKIGDCAFNLAGQTGIQIAAAIIAKSELYLGNDSGLSHLASAVQTPSIVIFGPTVKEFGFFPFRSNSVVIETELYCRPCTHIGNIRCPEKHFRCMEDISVEQVLEKISEII
ncbi:MAG: lipopolysaccharide heptosyltransferase II [FCB group bacterium]|nr:lipopolysaccharide heptosyltransferase II [FCB group bacterium]